MSDFYHGCTGGCFDSPVHWTEVDGWRYFYHNDPSEWTDDIYIQPYTNFSSFHELSDDFIVFPSAAVKKTAFDRLFFLFKQDLKRFLFLLFKIKWLL